MDQWYQSSSLLPYLTGLRDIQLDFSTVTERIGLAATEGEEGCGCSHILDNLCLRYNSTIFCGGSVLKKVSLVIQRDEYSSLHLKPMLTNGSIDECWQRALERRRSSRAAGHHVFLNGHTDGEGNIRPFAPLLYCRERRCFFHPPCARCGKMLQLCTDDSLLGEFGLPHYRRSQRRYLYCPDCTPLHGAPWFTLNSAGEDGRVVKDRAGLLNSFGAVNEKVESGLGFPCLDCSLRDTCYGPDNSIMERVTVIAFYPFYMFIDPEAVFDGEFFLGLLGGGTIREIMSKRSSELVVNTDAACRSTPYSSGDGYFFSASDSRHFLEVLYLKLLFLKQAAGNGNSSSLLDYMANRHVSPRELGVFCPTASSLPPFWNFALTYQSVEQVLEYSNSTAIKFRGSRMLFFGFFFFVVLLVNRNLQEEEILTKLQEILAQMENDDSTPFRGHELFHPRNIHWNPANSRDADAYGDVWRKTVDSGLSLLREGLKGKKMEQWLADFPLEKCMKEVESLLFHSVSVGGTTFDTAEEDKKILNILDDISEKWAGETETDVSAGAGSVTEEAPLGESADRNLQARSERFDPDATVIIPTDHHAEDGKEEKKLTKSKDFLNATLTQSFSNGPLAVDNAAGFDPPAAGNNSSAEETLISPVSFSQPERQPAGSFGPDHSSGEHDLLETVRIRKRAEVSTEQRAVTTKKKDPDNLLEETVVLGSNTRQRHTEPEIRVPEKGITGSGEQSDAGKTTIPPEDEDDFLTETVVLKPKRRDN